jgi:lipopolysaccharide transport system permease protein
MIRQLINPFRSYKYLLAQLTQREIKARYKQSVVGYAWVLLNPLAQILVYTFVFSIIFRFPTNNVPYVIYLYAALLPWSFSQTAISSGTQSLVENSSLLKKVSFPREVIPYASVIAKIVDLSFSAVLFLILTLVMGVSLAPTAVFFFPLFAIQLLLTTGLVLMLSSFNLFYRDIQYLTNLLMMLWMYMTPIVYPLSLVPQKYVWLYKLNPMVGIIEGYRAALFGYTFEPTLIWWSTFCALTIFCLGFFVFKKSERSFSDLV